MSEPETPAIFLLGQEQDMSDDGGFRERVLVDLERRLALCGQSNAGPVSMPCRECGRPRAFNPCVEPSGYCCYCAGPVLFVTGQSSAQSHNLSDLCDSGHVYPEDSWTWIGDWHCVERDPGQPWASREAMRGDKHVIANADGLDIHLDDDIEPRADYVIPAHVTVWLMQAVR